MAKRLVEIEDCPACVRGEATSRSHDGRLLAWRCGMCKGTGEIRTEVKVPEDDGAKVTTDWFRAVLPNTSSYGRRGDHKGKFGEISWLADKHDPNPGGFCAWLNGALLDWSEMTCGDLRRLCVALGVELHETNKGDGLS